MRPLANDLIGSRRIRTQKLERIRSMNFGVDVPKGTESDFASVPRIFWPIIPPSGEHTYAALAHDYLYAGGLVAYVRGDADSCPRRPRNRREADEIFREFMKADGVPAWREFLVYWAVRLFGWMSWEKSPQI